MDIEYDKKVFDKVLSLLDSRPKLEQLLYYECNSTIRQKVYYLAVESKNIKAMNTLAKHAMANYDRTTCIMLIDKAIELGDADSAVWLATYYRNSHYLDAALKYFNKALELGIKESLYEIGLIYRKKHNPDKAVEYLKKSAETGENRAYIELGKIYEQYKHVDTAIYYYNKLLESNCYDSQTIDSLAELYYRNNKVDGLKDLILNLIKKYNGGATNLINKIAALFKEYPLVIINIINGYQHEIVDIIYRPGGTGYEDAKKEYEAIAN